MHTDKTRTGMREKQIFVGKSGSGFAQIYFYLGFDFILFHPCASVVPEGIP
jgi:hypothetical protein